MPTIRRYERQVDLAPIQGGRQTVAPSAESFGASAGKALGDIGKNIYQDEVRRQDEVAVLEADRKMSEWENKRLYDPKNGALAVKGKDAFGLPDTINKEFDDTANEIAKGLSTPRQRDAFMRMRASRQRDVNGTLSRHVFNEIRQFDNNETSAYIANSQQAAANNYNDPERIGLEIERQHAAVSDFARRNGLEGSETERMLRERAVSGTHKLVIEKLLANGQDLAASRYYNGQGDAGDRLYKAAPGLLEKGNIDLKARKIATNADRSISTVRSMSFEEDGKEVVIPTVIDGKVVSDKEAIDQYHKTGEHLGKFDNPANADKFSEALHQAQAGFYGGAKFQMTGSEQIEMEKKLKVATTEGTAVRAVDDVWKSLGPTSDIAPVNADKMSEELRKRFGDEPGILKAAQTQLSERIVMHNAAQQERREANSSDVWGAIEKGVPITQIVRMQQFLALPGREQVQIKEHVADRAYNLSRRGKDDSDLSAYYDLVNMATDSNRRNDFVGMNLYEKYRTRLSDADFKHFATLQAAMRRGDDKEADKLASNERVQKQIVDDALLSLKLDPTPNEKTKPADVERILGFRREVREAVRRQELTTGKNATDKDVQGIVDNLLVRGTVPGSGVAGYFQTERRVFELKDGENLAIKRTDIPKDELTKIEDALRRAGRTPTDEAVTTLYQAKLMRMRGVPAAQSQAPRRPSPNDPKYVPE